MKFENTFKCLLWIFPITIMPLVGVAVAEGFIRYGFFGGLGVITLFGVVVMASLGLYQDFQVKAREDAERN